MLTLKEKVMEYIKNKDMENLKNLLAGAEAMEIMYAFIDLSSKEQVIVFRLLAKDNALALFEHLDTDLQQNLLRSFTDENAIEFVNELAPDDRVKLLDELPAGVAQKLISLLSPEEREVTNLIMGYKPETAGRVMTTEYVSLTRDMTVEQAVEKVRRQAQDKETIYTLFVTDNFRKLEGVLSFKELLVSDAGTEIGNIMSKKSINVSTDTEQGEVARILQELDLLAIPVVDKEERLVGIVTIDDAMDILEDEATDDILNLGGIFASKESNRSETLVDGSLWAILKVRMPFLFITIIGGMLAAIVLDGFEEILQAVVFVAFFIPLIMDMGGSVGTQSSTSFARGVVLGHIDMNKFFKHLVKEIGVGASIGLIAGSISGAIATVWQGDIKLGLAVGTALALTVTLAATLGFAVPFALMKLNADQAAGAAPIITTIKDISGILIYFTFVSIFLWGAISAAAGYEITEIRVTAGGFHYSLNPEEGTAVIVGKEEYKSYTDIPEEIVVMGEIFTVTGIDAGVFEDDGELPGLRLPSQKRQGMTYPCLFEIIAMTAYPVQTLQTAQTVQYG